MNCWQDDVSQPNSWLLYATVLAISQLLLSVIFMN